MALKLSVLSLVLLFASCHLAPGRTENSTASRAHPDDSIFAREYTEDGAAHAEEEHGGNTVSLFLGGTGNEEKDRGPTVGIDFEHKITGWMGVGFFAEGVGGDLRDFVGGGLIYFHPFENFTLATGPGVDYEDQKKHFIWRVGGAYEFSLGGGWHVGPALYYDMSNHESYIVAGLIFGTSF